MKTFHSLWIASISLVAAACGGMEQRNPLTTVPFVDLSRYSGTWYEIARLPMWFQRHCVDSKAIYTSRPDGAVGVHNECKTDSGGLDQVDGVATVVDQKTNARLSVVFDNFFARLFGSSRQGNYWILDLDQTGGPGEHLLGGIDALKLGYRGTEHVPPPNVTHIVLTMK